MSCSDAFYLFVYTGLFVSQKARKLNKKTPIGSKKLNQSVYTGLNTSRIITLQDLNDSPTPGFTRQKIELLVTVN